VHALPLHPRLQAQKSGLMQAPPFAHAYIPSPVTPFVSLITPRPGEEALLESANAPGSEYEPPYQTETLQRNGEARELLKDVENRWAVGSPAHPAWKAVPSFESAPSRSVRR
jgi:hypothetical protein